MQSRPQPISSSPPVPRGGSPAAARVARASRCLQQEAGLRLYGPNLPLTHLYIPFYSQSQADLITSNPPKLPLLCIHTGCLDELHISDLFTSNPPKLPLLCTYIPAAWRNCPACCWCCCWLLLLLLLHSNTRVPLHAAPLRDWKPSSLLLPSRACSAAAGPAVRFSPAGAPHVPTTSFALPFPPHSPTPPTTSLPAPTPWAHSILPTDGTPPHHRPLVPHPPRAHAKGSARTSC